MAAKKKFPYHSAFVACNGGCHEGNGDSSCSYGCIACGLCVNTCPYGAISMNEYGVAEVDEKKCTGCGKCAEACPFGLIVKTEGNPASKCIACGICAKACPMDVLEVVDE